MSNSEIRFLSESLEKEKNYWLQKLAGETGDASLPLDFKRSAEFNEQKKTVDFIIESEIANRLFNVSNRSESLVLPSS